MAAIERVCVFAGSSLGADASFAGAATELGRGLAARGWGLVYGGAAGGLMGVVADAVLAGGGEAIGVIPSGLMRSREVAHQGLSDLRVVESMHDRKGLMADLSDGFVALPGGFGTLEELCEAITWAQLGIHKKPVGVLDAAGYYTELLAFFERTVTQQFASRDAVEQILVGSTGAELLDLLAAYQPPTTARWLPPEAR